MFNFHDISKKLFHTKLSYEEYIASAKDVCKKYKDAENLDENYLLEDFMEEAKEALGLDKELIDSLVDDFVTQILMNIPLFKEQIILIKKDLNRYGKVNLTPLQELAHKNLGVARNLHVKNIQAILQTIRTSEDIATIEEYLEYLEACAILLRPELAYDIYTL